MSAVGITLPANYNELSPKQRAKVRAEYVERQGGRCSICGHPLNLAPAAQIQALRILPRLFPPNFFDYQMHLHHDHETGMTIGAVHARCNAAMWQFLGM